MKDLVFATNNLHKLDEVRAIVGESVKVLSLKEIGCEVDIPETGETLEDNALIKAQYVFGKYGCDCFADDTGLEVKELGNMPGVHSARYAGDGKNSKDNMLKLLGEMINVSDRSARFRTVIALIIEGKEFLFEGIVNGQIIKSMKGDAGFGYDPVFMPDSQHKTFAEINPILKNQISHRYFAIKKLKGFLEGNASDE
ncbi:MAG: non-canonical purine NTP diphosphatase [Dysgonamonadaceae bacterium]|jgi:XTP/dITP diphosphohydrolase|nr:non-canonical purine NTP diphosphatase [Dysgonamonadaceae bacterium]